MTPIEFKNFCAANRDAFFAKFPKPNTGARKFWRNSVQHASNSLECGGIAGDFDSETFTKAADRIRKYLQD